MPITTTYYPDNPNPDNTQNNGDNYRKKGDQNNDVTITTPEDNPANSNLHNHEGTTQHDTNNTEQTERIDVTLSKLDLTLAAWNTGHGPILNVDGEIENIINNTSHYAIIMLQEIQGWNKLHQQPFQHHILYANRISNHGILAPHIIHLKRQIRKHGGHWLALQALSHIFIIRTYSPVIHFHSKITDTPQ